MDGWIWVLVGFGCLAFELATPGTFVFFFFGCAGLVTAAAEGWGGIDSIWQQSIVFVASAVLGIVALRRRCSALLRPRAGHSDMNTMHGDLALAQTAIEPGGTGMVEHHGTSWTGRNVGPQPIVSGQRCRVQRVVGLTLELVAEAPPTSSSGSTS